MISLQFQKGIRRRIGVEKVISVRGPDKLKEQLDQLAQRQGFTRNGLILKILWDYVDNKEKMESNEGC